MCSSWQAHEALDPTPPQLGRTRWATVICKRQLSSDTPVCSAARCKVSRSVQPRMPSGIVDSSEQAAVHKLWWLHPQTLPVMRPTVGVLHHPAAQRLVASVQGALSSQTVAGNKFRYSVRAGLGSSFWVLTWTSGSDLKRSSTCPRRRVVYLYRNIAHKSSHARFAHLAALI